MPLLFICPKYFTEIFPSFQAFSMELMHHVINRLADDHLLLFTDGSIYIGPVGYGSAVVFNKTK